MRIADDNFLAMNGHSRRIILWSCKMCFFFVPFERWHGELETLNENEVEEGKGKKKVDERM